MNQRNTGAGAVGVCMNGRILILLSVFVLPTARYIGEESAGIEIDSELHG